MPGRKNEIKEYDNMLQGHIDRKDFIKICRTFKGREENISGFLLLLSIDFLLLQVDKEFILDGYAVIPKHQFDSIRCNKFDKTFKKIYKAEGVLDTQYGIDKQISLKSWQDLFLNLKRLDYHVIVECEDKEEPDFVIGPIKKVYKNKVGIQYFDPTGKLDERLTMVNYNEITIVRFGDRYTTTFRKHLRVHNSKAR